MEKLNTALKGIFTLIVLALAIWWLAVVAGLLGTAPTKDEKGNVLVDQYQRAKDILLVVLPLVTTAYGYWFGVQGKDKAEDKADKAQKKVDVLTAAAPDAVKAAINEHPEAFGLR